MFHEDLLPDTVLKFVFNNMKEVLKKMLLNGFNPTYSPPHSCSIYMLDNIGKDKQSFGLSRSDPTLLTDLDENAWIASALFDLENGSTDDKYPIGTFIGFVTNNPKKEDTPIFVGILICPSGEEMVGQYIPISTLSSTPLKLWGHPEDIFPFLHSIYIPSSNELKH